LTSNVTKSTSRALSSTGHRQIDLPDTTGWQQHLGKLGRLEGKWDDVHTSSMESVVCEPCILGSRTRPQEEGRSRSISRLPLLSPVAAVAATAVIGDPSSHMIHSNLTAKSDAKGDPVPSGSSLASLETRHWAIYNRAITVMGGHRKWLRGQPLVSYREVTRQGIAVSISALSKTVENGNLVSRTIVGKQRGKLRGVRRSSSGRLSILARALARRLATVVQVHSLSLLESFQQSFGGN
jgi:hypothetical protein